jgi:hypothetical protein
MARWMGVQFGVSGLGAILSIVRQWPSRTDLSTQWPGLVGFLAPMCLRLGIDIGLSIPFLMGSRRFRKPAVLVEVCALLAAVFVTMVKSRYGRPLSLGNVVPPLVLELVGAGFLLLGRPSRTRLWIGAILTCLCVLVRVLALLGARSSSS